MKRIDRQSGGARLLPLVVLAAAMILMAGTCVTTAAQSDAFRLFEEGKAAYDRGDYDAAVQAFTRTLGLIPADHSNSRVVLLQRARAYQEQGKLKKAWIDVNRVIRESGALEGAHRANGLLIRADIQLEREREKQALRDLTEAIKTRHDDIDLRYVSFAKRGQLYIRLREFDRAVSDLNQAIHLGPTSAEAYAVRALAYLRKDNIDLARRDAERALRMNPDERTRNLAKQVIKNLAISSSGPDRVIVPIGDDGHIRVRMRFGGRGKPHIFMLDTGATHSLVKREVLEQIRRETLVREVGKGRVRTADGRGHAVTRYKIHNAFLYNLPLGDIEVHVFDHSLKGVINLLGSKSLRNLSISIDTATRRAEIYLKGVPAARLQ